MKKIIIILMVIATMVMLTGCDGLDGEKCKQNAEDYFNDDSIFTVGSYEYLSIRENGDIFLLSATEISSARISKSTYITTIDKDSSDE